MNQIENAAAAIKLNHDKEIQYSEGKPPLCIPSTGRETRYKIKPPRNKVDELSTNGFIQLPRTDTITLLTETPAFANIIINTPSSSIADPSFKACLPALIRITPAIPEKIVAIFFLVILSS